MNRSTSPGPVTDARKPKQQQQQLLLQQQQRSSRVSKADGDRKQRPGSITGQQNTADTEAGIASSGDKTISFQGAVRAALSASRSGQSGPVRISLATEAETGGKKTTRGEGSCRTTTARPG